MIKVSKCHDVTWQLAALHTLHWPPLLNARVGEWGEQKEELYLFC